MSISRLIRATGSQYFCGCVIFQGTPCLAYEVNQTVVVETIDATVIWTSAAIGEQVQWVRAAASPTEVQALVTGNVSGHAFHLSNNGATVTDLGATWGAPSAMEYFGGTFRAAIQRTGTTFDYGPIGGFLSATMALTSQGFIDLINGVPIRADDQFTTSVGAYTILRWMERWPVIAGQWPTLSGAAVVFRDRDLALTLIPEDAFEVQLALLPLTPTEVQLVVAARTPIGSQLAVDSGPYTIAPGAGGFTGPGVGGTGGLLNQTLQTGRPTRIYPHVTEIQDWPARQTSRLLWDRTWDVTEQLQSAQATITGLSSAQTALLTRLAAVEQTARQALIASQAPSPAGGGASSVGGTTTPSGDNFPQPYDPLINPNPELGRTESYVIARIQAAFDYFTDQNPGTKPEADQTYWLAQFWTKNTPDPGGSGDGWGQYWWDRIQNSPGVPL